MVLRTSGEHPNRPAPVSPDQDANRCRLGGGVVAGATGPVSGAHGRPVEVTEERGNEV